MCGILGYTKQVGMDARYLLSIQKHRGPDFESIFDDGYMVLGHNLLAIRDVAENSKQPYTRAHSDWVIVFNGQIYNTQEIQRELGGDALGIDLDTELLFRLIEKYEFNFISHIQGMYAIAVYQRSTKTLKLYRDFSGQKHIYYYHRNNQFIFASEIKTILACDVNKDIDHEAVSIATSIGYIPGYKTIFTHIKKLMPGEILSFQHGMVTKHIERHTNNTYTKSIEENWHDLIAEHLQSKQSIAINLSGGLDSSLLVHEMKHAGYTPITYTTRFKDAESSVNTDADLAMKLAADYGAQHHEVLVSKESYMDLYAKTYETVEEPNYNISLPAYMQIAMAEGIHGDKHRVILSGNGGDEIYAGYPYYQDIHRMNIQQRLITPYLYNRIKNARNKTNCNYANPSEQWLSTKTFTQSWNDASHTKEYIDELWHMYAPLHGNPKGIRASMVMDRMLWMASENFVQADRITMSQSMELRSPLSYDPWRVYMDSILTSKDYSGDMNKPWLRTYYDSKLPDYITKRKDKTGWRSPVSTWYDKDMKDMFLSFIEPYKNETNHINWKGVYEYIAQKDTWPGKYVHLYLSLALLSKQFKVIL